MATMAAWTNSPAPGPTKVAPSTAPVCRSTASLASPWALPCRGSSGGRGVADLSSDDVLAGVAGPLFGQAAGGELGGGEDNLWDRDVLGYWFGLAAGSEGGDPLPYDARPVLAHVGQLGLAAGVADGVKPVGQAAGQDVVGLRPTTFGPMPVRRGGRRPVGTRISSASMVRPAQVTVTGPPWTRPSPVSLA